MKQEVIITEEYQRVFDAIDQRVPFIFINGKAGVGKSVLIGLLKKRLEKEKKNAAFVAPTGIAALNIGGVTINSLFRFPPRILLPSDIRKPKNPEIFNALDVLLIDEVSMLRCDMVDAIDLFLKKARKNKKPFGGVPVMFVGDLFQLPPVISEIDADVLAEMGYSGESYYFFDAKIFNQLPVTNIELTKVFRQEDVAFAELLSHVRLGGDVDQAICELNRQCFGREPHPMAVTLTSTNVLAEQKNFHELAKLPGTEKTFIGELDGKFSLSGRSLPAPEKLILKVGAKVMFTANDKEGLWSNGSMGIVQGMTATHVDVKLSTGAAVKVGRNKWIAFEYFSGAGGALSQREVGSYSQIPLVLAWGITIHKSQGQSLEFLHINLGYGAFATGQTYVALSRARNVEGMTFEKPIRKSDVKTCGRVKQFLNPEFSLQ